MYPGHHLDPSIGQQRHWFAWAYLRGVAAILTVVVVSYLYASLEVNWNIPEMLRQGYGLHVEARASALWGVSVDAPVYVTFAEFVVTRLSNPLVVVFLGGGALVAATLGWRAMRDRTE